MSIRISAGSAARMGLMHLKSDAPADTAYLLHGASCSMNCSFCPQAREAAGLNGRLGRVSWPSFSREAMLKGLQQAREQGMRRICLQAVREMGGPGGLPELVKQVSSVGLPVSVSSLVRSPGEVEALFEAGAERVSLALDVVNPRLFARYKGGDFMERLNLLLHCARCWPGRMVTHIICGLGETEQELLSCAALLVQEQVTVALFAFTPLKGTALQGHPPPDGAVYRRMQAALFLLRKGAVSLAEMKFNEGRLVSFGLEKGQLRQQLQGGAAFQTSGCPGCNRPYYNERPGGFIYNYPRPLTEEEIEKALEPVLSCC